MENDENLIKKIKISIYIMFSLFYEKNNLIEIQNESMNFLWLITSADLLEFLLNNELNFVNNLSNSRIFLSVLRNLEDQ